MIINSQKMEKNILKMAYYKVTGIAKNRKTGSYIGKSRSEIINTKTNSLFKNVKDTKEVKSRYEYFWNDLNPKSEEVVKVLKVEKLK